MSSMAMQPRFSIFRSRSTELHGWIYCNEAFPSTISITMAATEFRRILDCMRLLTPRTRVMVPLEQTGKTANGGEKPGANGRVKWGTDDFLVSARQADANCRCIRQKDNLCKSVQWESATCCRRLAPKV